MNPDYGFCWKCLRDNHEGSCLGLADLFANLSWMGIPVREDNPFPTELDVIEIEEIEITG